MITQQHQQPNQLSRTTKNALGTTWRQTCASFCCPGGPAPTLFPIQKKRLRYYIIGRYKDANDIQRDTEEITCTSATRVHREKKKTNNSCSQIDYWTTHGKKCTQEKKNEEMRWWTGLVRNLQRRMRVDAPWPLYRTTTCLLNSLHYLVDSCRYALGMQHAG